MRNPDWEDYRFEYSSLKFVQRADGRALELGRGATGVVKKVRARARVGLEFGRPCTCLTDCGHARSHAPQVVVDGVQTFAAKIVELPGPTAQRLFLKEVALLFRLRHKNVVAFTGVCTHEDTGILLMEVRVGGPARAGAPPRAWLTRAPPLPSPPPPSHAPTQYCEGRDLFSALHGSNNGESFRWSNRGKRILLDVARGLHYLHNLVHVVHMDLKSGACVRGWLAGCADGGTKRGGARACAPRCAVDTRALARSHAGNVLLTREGAAKISDVGFSKIYRHSQQQLSIDPDRAGTWAYMVRWRERGGGGGGGVTAAWRRPPWAPHVAHDHAIPPPWVVQAPEVMTGASCTEKVDIYSFGVLLWEVVTGEQRGSVCGGGACARWGRANARAFAPPPPHTHARAQATPHSAATCAR